MPVRPLLVTTGGRLWYTSQWAAVVVMRHYRHSTLKPLYFNITSLLLLAARMADNSADMALFQELERRRQAIVNEINTYSAVLEGASSCISFL